MKTNPELKELLDFDPLALAEEVGEKLNLGQDQEMALGLLLSMESGDRKNRALRERDDTVLNNKLETYTRIIQEEGFEKVLEVPFQADGWSKDDPKRNEKLFVYWNPVGFLLVFDTYNETSVNGGHLYYNLKPKFPPNEKGRVDLHTSSGSFSGTGIWAGDHDCREALRYHLSEIYRTADVLPKWERRPFLWLLHHGDTKGDYKSYNHEQITADRIAMLPAHVQDAITP